ncbi:MAG: trehalose-6-phosphate synthase [Deltaproteobacteria bacterium]|nr:trehalose-6-phosphate synthase [Deltaproteobacteria bacterium]
MSDYNHGRNEEFRDRLIVVSNRLPVVLLKDKQGQLTAAPGSGGLVTALSPVLKDRGGLWIGWPGDIDASKHSIDAVLACVSKSSGFDLEPVVLSPEEIQQFYYGFSNEIIWPLFHDLLSRCNFDPSYWSSYCNVNRKYALAIQQQLKINDFIWIHDYHLMNVAQELRSLGVTNKIGFFLHTPFPQLDIFMKLPWKWEILKSLLTYDCLGFQSLRDKRNFIQCVRTLISNVHFEDGRSIRTIRIADRTVRIGTFPISIDSRAFAAIASSSAVEQRTEDIRSHLKDVKIILGIDRLDYTKGIPERLKAFRRALIRYPELHRKVVLVQFVVPSRSNIAEYNDLKIEIERLVGEINGQFTADGWVPIHYIFRSLDSAELIAYYRTADIGFITPMKDGMNLIAKEYCACSIDGKGVLILSEFAGAAAQVQKWALLVNPFDQDRTADAIFQAFSMPVAEQQRRMSKIRSTLNRYDIYWWVNAFLENSIAKRLNSFPVIEDYMPQHEMA